MRRNDTRVHLGLLILRVAFGVSMLWGHGLGKLTSFAEKAPVFLDPLGIGNKASLILTLIAEVGCSILLILGMGTRVAALILGFTMGVAAFVVHGNDPWAKRELAVVYLMVYVVLLIAGAGAFSLDRLFWGRESDDEILD